MKKLGTIFLLILFFQNNSYAKKKVLCPTLMASDTFGNAKFSILVKSNKPIHVEIIDDTKIVKSVVQSPNSVYRNINNMTIPFSELAFNKKYFLRVSSHGKILEEKEFIIQKKATHDSVNLLIGSCAFIGTGIYRALKIKNSLEIFNTLTKETNDGMIWLGDNVYYLLEYRREKLEIRRMTKIRKKKAPLQRFLSSTEQYAIWDDHDFGPNNCDGSFKGKKISEKVFKTFWPNPYDSNLVEGNYFRFQKGDVEVFMLDGRYFSKKWDTLLGETQMQWLFEGLKNSKAAFKILCFGNQVINPYSGGETYAKFQKEYQYFLQKIIANKIEGVVLMSGDRHHADLEVLKQENMYPLYNFTTSPLTSWLNPVYSGSKEYLSPLLVSGTIVNDYNYGMLEISGEQGNRILTIYCKNKSGDVIWKHSILEKELKF